MAELEQYQQEFAQEFSETEATDSDTIITNFDYQNDNNLMVFFLFSFFLFLFLIYTYVNIILIFFIANVAINTGFDRI